MSSFCDFLRVGDLRHAFRHRPMRDDLGTLEELVAPDVVAVLVRVDHAPRHARPDLAEQLDHPAPVGQVRLRVDDHAAAQIDEPRVRVAHAVLLVQDREAVVADLLQIHEGLPVRWLGVAPRERFGAGRGDDGKPGSFGPAPWRCCRARVICLHSSGRSELLLLEVARHRSTPVSNTASGPSIGIPQNVKTIAPSSTNADPAVTVTELDDPTAAGASIELIDQDAVQLQSCLFGHGESSFASRTPRSCSTRPTFACGPTRASARA